MVDFTAQPIELRMLSTDDIQTIANGVVAQLTPLIQQIPLSNAAAAAIAAREALDTLITSLFTKLTKEIQQMSGTLEAQLQAGLTTIQSDMTTMATDLQTIVAQLTPGQQLTQADIDQLNAVVAAANSVAQSTDAIVNPPAPPPEPPAAPPPDAPPPAGP